MSPRHPPRKLRSPFRPTPTAPPPRLRRHLPPLKPPSSPPRRRPGICRRSRGRALSDGGDEIRMRRGRNVRRTRVNLRGSRNPTRRSPGRLNRGIGRGPPPPLVTLVWGGGDHPTPRRLGLNYPGRGLDDGGVGSTPAGFTPHRRSAAKQPAALDCVEQS